MIKEFKFLSKSEYDLMISLPIYIVVLIANADGDIDTKEMKKAISLADYKSKNARKELIPYYNQVNIDFEGKLKMLIANLPDSGKESKLYLINKLKESNAVFIKLSKSYAISLHSSLKEIAKQIAEASGGVLGYMAVDFEEAKLIDLKMIKDIS